MNAPTSPASAWEKLAGRTALKANLAWWTERTAPLWVVFGTLGFAIILWLRSRMVMIAWAELWLWMAGAAAVAAGVGFVVARRRFMTAREAMVRIESRMGLHNGLSAAAAGCGQWPAIPRRVDDGWRWRWTRVLAPVAAFALLHLAAMWMPISGESPMPPARVEPQSWAQMDDWLDKLHEEKVITAEEKEEQAAKVAELREQPPDRWFSHESLNAGDTLKEQLSRDIANLGQNLAKAGRSLELLQNHAADLSAAAKDQLLKDFADALDALGAGDLGLDPQLLKELAQIDPNKLNQLSQQQLNEFRDSLKRRSGACKDCEGGEFGSSKGFLGDGEGEDDAIAAMMRLLQKEGKGLPGEGGIDRGPGTAPLTLSDEENRFETNRNQGVNNPDLSRAQLGATLDIKDGRHDVDKTQGGPQPAGAVGHAGKGGEQVWRESLTPDEKAVLKKVFQ